ATAASTIRCSVQQPLHAAISMIITPGAAAGAGRSRMTSGVRGFSSVMARMPYLRSRERRRHPRQQSYSEPHVLHVGIGIEAVARLVAQPDQTAGNDADQLAATLPHLSPDQHRIHILPGPSGDHPPPPLFSWPPLLA